MLWVIVQAFSKNDSADNIQKNLTEINQAPPEVQPVLSQIDQLQQLLIKGENQAALLLAEKIEFQVLDDERINNSWRYRYLFSRGDIHWNLWHFVDAEKYWSMAMAVPHSANKQQLSQRLQQVNKTIAEANSERLMQTEYMSAPGVGPASDLIGKVTVVYVFVKVGNTEAWSLKDRQSALNAWAQAHQWLSEWAAFYAKKV